MAFLTPKGIIKDLLRGDLSRLNKSISRRNLRLFLQKEFSSIQPAETVLSIGSGGEVNQLLIHFSEVTGFSVTQLDIDESRNPDIVADLCGNMDFHKTQYSTIVLSEVLEHCYNPQSALDNIYRLLLPGGKLILSVPFIFPIHEVPNDYYRFTRYGLSHLLRNFSNVNIHERSSYFETFAVLLVRLKGSGNGFGRVLTGLSTFLAFLILPIALVLRGFTPSTAPVGYLVTAQRSVIDDIESSGKMSLDISEE